MHQYAFVKTFSKSFKCKKGRIFMNSLKFTVLHNNEFYRCIMCYQLSRPYIMILTYFASSIHLLNHCKYMTVYLISFLKYLCLFVSSNTIIINLFESIQQTTSSNLLMMPHQLGIFGRRNSKNKINEMKYIYRGISFLPSSNNTPSSTSYCVVSKIKSVSEEKYNEELPAVIGDYYSYYPLIIVDDLKMGETSDGKCYMNNHTLYQQYYEFNNSDVISGNYIFTKHITVI